MPTRHAPSVVATRRSLTVPPVAPTGAAEAGVAIPITRAADTGASPGPERAAAPAVGLDTVSALVPAMRGQPWHHAERLAAIARLSTTAELAAISTRATVLRAACLLLGETARALHALLVTPRAAGWPSAETASAEVDVAVRRALAGRVARMVEWYRMRLAGGEAHVAPAHYLCQEVHGALIGI